MRCGTPHQIAQFTKSLQPKINSPPFSTGVSQNSCVIQFRQESWVNPDRRRRALGKQARIEGEACLGWKRTKCSLRILGAGSQLVASQEIHRMIAYHYKNGRVNSRCMFLSWDPAVVGDIAGIERDAVVSGQCQRQGHCRHEGRVIRRCVYRRNHSHQ